MQFTISTADVVRIENYPYGYNQKTTLYDSIEFKPGKGYRHVTQTVNPKTGRLNAPKKSTYSHLILRRFDEEGKLRALHYHFNDSDKSLNLICKIAAENFDLFTTEERKYLYENAILFSKVSMKAQVIYCGSEVEALKPLFGPFIREAIKGLNTPDENFFGGMILDLEAIEAAKVPGYNPFKTVNHFKIG
jgi:signal peptidase I